MRRSILVLLWVPLILLIASCGGGGGSTSAPSSKVASTSPDAVFIGSSDTLYWNLSTSFPDKKYVNKGWSGDTSAKMLARFQTDVVSLHPTLVHIWGGNNDIEQNLSMTELQNNIDGMVKQARAAGIRPVLATLIPQRGASATNNPAIVSFNTWLQQYGTNNNVPVADYYTAVVDPTNGTLRADLTQDDTHLNAAGYVIITPYCTAKLAAAQ